MDELQISGRRYVSSRRVAKDNGYHSDYIGQLIRGGKVRGQKVGRAWYVDAESFDSYMSGEGAVAPADNLELVADSKEKQEVPVDTPDIAAEEEKEEGSIPEEIPVLQPEPAQAEEVKEIKVEIKKEPEKEPKLKAESYQPQATSGLRYYSDDAPLLPEIPSKKRESRISVSDEGEESPAEEVITQVPARAQKMRKAPVLGLLAFGIVSLVAGVVLSSALSLNINIDKDNPASAVYSFDINDSASLIKTVK